MLHVGLALQKPYAQRAGVKKKNELHSYWDKALDWPMHDIAGTEFTAGDPFSLCFLQRKQQRPAPYLNIISGGNVTKQSTPSHSAHCSSSWHYCHNQMRAGRRWAAKDCSVFLQQGKVLSKFQLWQNAGCRRPRPPEIRAAGGKLGASWINWRSSVWLIGIRCSNDNTGVRDCPWKRLM